MALVSASSIIKLAGEGKTDEVMKSLESAKEILVRRAIRIAKRRQEIVAVVELKKVLKKVAGTTVVEVSVDEKVALLYKIERTPQVDPEYFDAICEIAKAKKGRLIHATPNASYYGYVDKAQGTKFAAEAIKRIESIPQCKGIKITLDKEGVGNELASAREKKNGK
jgi:copper chaperone CopZ